MPRTVAISLAGAMTVTVDGRPAGTDPGAPPLGPLGRLAFALLVLERQRPVPRAELAEVLWGEELPATWPASLRGVLARVRRALSWGGAAAPGTIVATSGCYRLTLPPCTTVDVEVGAHCLDAARSALARGDPARAFGLARQAVDALGGELLPGATGVWVERQQALVRERHARSLEVLSTAARQVGDLVVALDSARSALAAEPYRESTHALVMEAHLAAGNRAEALRAYERCQRLLDEDLGVPPSPALEAAFVRALSDEARDPPRAPVPAEDDLAVRRLLARLTVFPGGFTLKSVLAVCGADDLDRVQELVATGRLAVSSGPGGTRYALAAGVTANVRDRPADLDDAPALRRRQLRWAAALTRRAAAALSGPEQARWLETVATEHANLRYALDWAASDDPVAGLRMAVELARFWEVRGHLLEGRDWLQRLSVPSAPVGLRIRALCAAAILAHHQSDFGAARRLYARCLTICRSSGDRAGALRARNGLGHLAVSQGEFARAGRIFTDNLAAAAALGDEEARAATLLNLAIAQQLRAGTGGGDATTAYEHAERRLVQALDAHRSRRDQRGVALVLESLGALAHTRGQPDSARAHLVRSLAIRRELGDQIGIAGCSRFLGQIALQQGHIGTARAYLEECLSIEDDLGSAERAGEVRRLVSQVATAALPDARTG